MIKKALSALLIVVLTVIAVTVLSVTSSAREVEGADLGAQVDLAEIGNPYNIDAKDSNGDWANCTYWAWQYAHDYDGVNLPGWSHGGTWYASAQNAGFNCDRTPSAHSIMCTGSGTYGHVAYVTDYDSTNGKVYIKQGGYRYSSDGRDERWVSAYPSDLQGYIHLGSGNTNSQGYVMSESEGAGQTIPDGDYWIISKIAEDYFVDIPGNDFDTINEQNVQTWRWSSGLPPIYDVFRFSYLGNGFYKITQINTNMVIDVYGGYLERGSNISMWTYTGSVAQQWSIEKTDGGYKIRSRCNNFYMDIYDGKLESGTNILTWESHSGNNQLFSFIPYAPDEQPVANGTYKIASAVADACYLDIYGGPDFNDKDNIQVYNIPDEKFDIEYAGNGYYWISEANSHLMMEVNNDGELSFLSNGRNVMVFSKNNGKNQLWKIRKNSDGTYYFINQLSGYCLDLEHANTESGTNVSQYQFNGYLNQKWKLLRIIEKDMVTVSDIVLNNTSEAINPKIIVKMDNSVLEADTDYSVSIKANVEQGKGRVTITGINNYCDAVTKEFSISVAEPSVTPTVVPTVKPTETMQYLLGDADGDGYVTIMDATAIQRYLAHYTVSNEEMLLKCGDVNGDGVDIMDATAIQRFLAHYDDPYHIGEAIKG